MQWVGWGRGGWGEMGSRNEKIEGFRKGREIARVLRHAKREKGCRTKTTTSPTTSSLTRHFQPSPSNTSTSHVCVHVQCEICVQSNECTYLHAQVVLCVENKDNNLTYHIPTRHFQPSLKHIHIPSVCMYIVKYAISPMNAHTCMRKLRCASASAVARANASVRSSSAAVIAVISV